MMGPRDTKRASTSYTGRFYKIVCISLYVEDIAALDAKVRELKARGHSKASKSSLIRFALAGVNLDDYPRSP